MKCAGLLVGGGVGLDVKKNNDSDQYPVENIKLVHREDSLQLRESFVIGRCETWNTLVLYHRSLKRNRTQYADVRETNFRK